MTTNDEHLAELLKLAAMYEKSAGYFGAISAFLAGYERDKR